MAIFESCAEHTLEMIMSADHTCFIVDYSVSRICTLQKIYLKQLITAARPLTRTGSGAE